MKDKNWKKLLITFTKYLGDFIYAKICSRISRSIYSKRFTWRLYQRELTLTERIAVLRIKNTTSYHILFLDDYKDMDEIDKEIEERLDGQLYNFNARQIIEGHLNARN